MIDVLVKLVALTAVVGCAVGGVHWFITELVAATEDEE